MYGSVCVSVCALLHVGGDAFSGLESCRRLFGSLCIQKGRENTTHTHTHTPLFTPWWIDIAPKQSNLLHRVSSCIWCAQRGHYAKHKTVLQDGFCKWQNQTCADKFNGRVWPLPDRDLPSTTAESKYKINRDEQGLKKKKNCRSFLDFYRFVLCSVDLIRAQMHTYKHMPEQVILIITLSAIFSEKKSSTPNTEEFDRCKRHVNWSGHVCVY